MEGATSVFRKIYRMVVVIFATAIFSTIFIMCMISTCYITSEEYEITFFCKNNILVNIAFLIVSTCILVLMKVKGIFSNLQEKLNDDSLFKKAKFTLLLIILCLGLTWVFITQFVPGSDQLDVMSSAYKIRCGDYSVLAPGGYLDRWNNQLGLTLIEYLFGRVFGDYNVMGFQFLNCFGLALLYLKLVDIMDKLHISRMAQIITLFLGVLFIPMIMYTSFVYGTIWSVALALWAFDFELKYLSDNKVVDLVGCALLIGVAIQVKNNVLIMMIAMIIYGLICSIKDIRSIKRSLLLLIIICVSFIAFSKAPQIIVEKKTGYSLSQGVSSWSFVAMGLQNENHAPGWSNGYNYTTYEESNCITAVQEERAKADIADRMALFKENSHYAFEFFSQKIASMWTEPTYQSFWINQIRNHRVSFPEWLDWLMSTNGYTFVSGILGYYQLFLFSGCLLWVILEDSNQFISKSFFVITVIGGFLFHLAWEAKSQYSITYIVLMIPIAVMGYELFINKLWCAIESLRTGEGLKKLSVRYTALLSVLVMATYVGIYKFDGTQCLTADSGYYEKYLEAMVMPYTAETVRDINIINAERRHYKELAEYFVQLLGENGIDY